MNLSAANDEPVTEFFDRYAAAWNAFDVEALLDCFGFPHLVATAAQTHFYEDDAEALSNLEAMIVKYRANGVTGIERTALRSEALPDEAARATVGWRLLGTAGTELLAFTTLYTLAAEAGEWLIVALDAQAEVEAWAAAGRG